MEGDMIKELVLNKECSVNRACSKTQSNRISKWYPVCYAVDKGNIEVVSFLISKGAKLNNESYIIERGRKRWFTPLYLACKKEDLEMIRLLVTSGADINQRIHGVQISEEEGGSINYSYEDTYLHFAVKRNKLSVVETLLECGSDVNVVNKFQESPLHNACDLLNPAMVVKLAQYGCLNNQCDDSDMTPLAYLLKYNPVSTLNIHDQIQNAILFLIAAGYNIYTDVCWKTLWFQQRSELESNHQLILNKMFIEFMKKLMEEALTLKQQCRGVLRQYFISQNTLAQVKNLPVPALVRRYLSLEKP